MLEHVVLMEIPTPSTTQPAQVGSPRPRSVTATTKPAIVSSETETLRRRVIQLEEENRKLKAQLDLMKDLVGPKGTTLPSTGR
jgi:hypothetical protein